MLNVEEIRQKLFELPDLFVVHYRNKEYAQAKGCYETARTVALFVRLDEKEMDELFGSRQSESKQVEGMFNEELVQRAYLECIKANQTYERKAYPGAPRKTA